jgi:hypothetical protein
MVTFNCETDWISAGSGEFRDATLPVLCHYLGR